jgi:hypothetical protein
MLDFFRFFSECEEPVIEFASAPAYGGKDLEAPYFEEADLVRRPRISSRPVAASLAIALGLVEGDSGFSADFFSRDAKKLNSKLTIRYCLVPDLFLSTLIPSDPILVSMLQG